MKSCVIVCDPAKCGTGENAADAPSAARPGMAFSMQDTKIDALLRFLAGMDELRGRGEMASAFGRLAASCGFDCYCLFRIRPPAARPEEMVLAAQLPQGWIETYRDRHYLHADPMLHYLGQAQAGFRWRDALAAFRASPQRKRMERMMADAHRAGLQDGYTFPVHGRGGLAGGLSVAGRPVELHPAEASLFEAVARRLFWKLYDAAHPVPEAASPAGGIGLTRREMEALRLLAEGMTSPEIAQRLGITSHTVDWYMNGIQAKLQARNRPHAVALAFRLGLVS